MIKLNWIKQFIISPGTAHIPSNFIWKLGWVAIEFKLKCDYNVAKLPLKLLNTIDSYCYFLSYNTSTASLLTIFLPGTINVFYEEKNLLQGLHGLKYMVCNGSF